MAETYAKKYISQLKMHATRQGGPAPDLYICFVNLYSDLIEKEPTRKIGVFLS